MEHKRITVEEVLAAYESTGVRKTKAAYYWADHDVDEGAAPIDCGCPAFAVAMARTGQTVATLRAANAGCVRGAEFTHDQFHPGYLGGFTLGVDTGNPKLKPGDNDTLSAAGHEDGLAVRAALWPEQV